MSLRDRKVSIHLHANHHEQQNQNDDVFNVISLRDRNVSFHGLHTAHNVHHPTVKTSAPIAKGSHVLGKKPSPSHSSIISSKSNVIESRFKNGGVILPPSITSPVRKQPKSQSPPPSPVFAEDVSVVEVSCRAFCIFRVCTLGHTPSNVFVCSHSVSRTELRERRRFSFWFYLSYLCCFLLVSTVSIRFPFF